MQCAVILLLATQSDQVNAERNIEKPAVYNISLPPQSVAKSLSDLSEQTDQMLLFSYEEAEKLRASPVVGKYTLLQALDIMLKGTGYSGSLTKKGVLMISLSKSEVADKKTEEIQSMNTRKQVLASVASILIGSGGVQSAMSQESAEAEVHNDDTIESVMVVGKRVVGRNRTNDIEPVLSYDVEFFQRFEPVSVRDMLKRIPGIQFASLITESAFTGRGNGENPGLTFRGIANRGGQVLINGRKMPGANSVGTFDLSTIPADIVKEVRVIRSPTAEIDSQGTGLTIDIILKDGSDFPEDQKINWRVSAKENKGIFGSTVGLTTAAALSDRTSYTANLSYTEAPNIFRTRTEGDVETKTDIESETLSFNGNLYTGFDNNSQLAISSYINISDASDRLFTPDSPNAPPLLTESSNKTETANVVVDYQFFFGKGHTTSLEAGYAVSTVDAPQSANLLDPLEADTPNRINDFESEEITLKADVTLQLSDAQELKLGVSGGMAESEDNLFVPGSFGLEDQITNRQRENDELDAFVSYSIELTEGLVLQVGNRYESNDYQLRGDISDAVFDLDTSELVPIEFEQDDVTFDNSGNNQTVNLQWRISKRHQLRLSYARTVNLPTLEQVAPTVSISPIFEEPNIGRIGASTGSPDLEPERSDGYDLSYDFSFYKTGNVGISIFDKETRDQVIFRAVESRAEMLRILPDLELLEQQAGLGQVATLSIPANSDGKFKSRGAEIDFSIPMQWFNLPNMSLSSNMSYFETETIQGSDSTLNDETDYQFSANFTLDHLIPDWAITYGISYNYVSGTEETSFFGTLRQSQKTERDPSVNVFVQKRFSQYLVARLNIDNALDAEDTFTATSVDSADPTNNFSFTNMRKNEPTISLTLRGSF